MKAKRLKAIRQLLSNEHENLIASINRSRTAAQEIKPENTEDEIDLAAISHERDLLYNLHEGGFARLRVVREAIKALDLGKYGECVRCGEAINEKRLEAVPWATLCIQCQEATEAAHVSERKVQAGAVSEETEF